MIQYGVQRKNNLNSSWKLGVDNKQAWGQELRISKWQAK